MQKVFTTLLIVAISSLMAFGQVKVVHHSSLPESISKHIIPDVKGLVLYDGSATLLRNSHQAVDTITPYPLWPVSRVGANERGGIFANIDTDPQLEVLYTIGQKLYAWKKSGISVPGWPRDLLLVPDGAPSFGDLDGDGFGEIVVTTHTVGSFNEGYIYAFEMNGTNMPGFPKLISGGAVRTPVLADLDDDGADEIIVAVRDWPDGFVYVFKGNGTIFPGWPVRMNDVPATTVAVGDITGDGVPEVIAESYATLHAYYADGSLLEGFPFFPESGRVFSHSSPVLADIDDDGQREIIFGDHSSSQQNGRVYILKNDGTAFPGWPKTTSSWIYSPPSVGDLDNDGNLDVIVADYFHETTPSNHLYAWDAQSGNALPGFPVDSVYGVFSQALLVDIDSDDFLEVIIDANIGPDGLYLAFNHDGSAVEDWPVTVNGTTFTINPMVFDVDGDGILDISGGGYDPDLDKTYIYLWNGHQSYDKDKMVLPILQYNTRHNGVYGDYLMVGQEELIPGNATISIHPNPLRPGAELMVYGLEDEMNIRAQWLDITGKVIKEILFKTSGSPLKIPGTGLTPGVYFLRLIEGRQSIFAGKVIIVD